MTWIATIVLLCAAAVMACNWSLPIRYVFGNRTVRGSVIPVIGGLLGCLGLLIHPDDGAATWCWVPLVLDVGCLPVVVAALLGSRLRRD